MAETIQNWGLQQNSEKVPFKANTLSDPASIPQASIDENNTTIITTTAALAGALTLPAPTDTTAGQYHTVVNDDDSTDDFEVNGKDIVVGQSFRFEWDGDAWTTGGGGADALYQGIIPAGNYDFTVFPAPTTGNTYLDAAVIAGDAIPAGTHFIAGGDGSFQLFDGGPFITVEFTEGDKITITEEAINFPNAKLNINADTGGDLQAIVIDSGAAVLTETLDASTGEGLVKLFVNDDVTNLASLAVQTGETLNGVVDGTFFFSNYATGTQFRADEVNGGWVVDVVGASTQTGLVYFHATQNGSGAMFTTAGVNLAGLENVTDPMGIATNATGVSDFVLPHAGRYRIEFSGHVNSATTGGDIQIDSGSGFINVLDLGFVTNDEPTMSYEYEAQAGDIVRVKADTTMTLTYGYFRIQQLPTTEAVLAGMVTPQPLADVAFSNGTAIEDFPNNTAVGIGSYTVISEGVTVDQALKRFTLAQSDIPYHCEAYISFDVDTAANSDALRMRWQLATTDGSTSTNAGSHNIQAAVSDGVSGTSDGAADFIGTRAYALVDASAGDVEIQLRSTESGTDLDFVDMSGRIYQAAQSSIVLPEAITVQEPTYFFAATNDNGNDTSVSDNDTIDFNFMTIQHNPLGFTLIDSGLTYTTPSGGDATGSISRAVKVPASITDTRNVKVSFIGTFEAETTAAETFSIELYKNGQYVTQAQGTTPGTTGSVTIPIRYFGTLTGGDEFSCKATNIEGSDDQIGEHYEFTVEPLLQGLVPSLDTNIIPGNQVYEYATFPVSTQTGAYTTVPADLNTYVRVNANVTLHSPVLADIGKEIHIRNYSNTDITISSAATLNGLADVGEHETVIAKVIAVGAYDLTGGK